jgi:hypothetical protein
MSIGDVNLILLQCPLEFFHSIFGHLYCYIYLMFYFYIVLLLQS